MCCCCEWWSRGPPWSGYIHDCVSWNRATFSHIWEGARWRVLVGAVACTHKMAHERTTRKGMFHCSALRQAPHHRTLQYSMLPAHAASQHTHNRSAHTQKFAHTHKNSTQTQKFETYQPSSPPTHVRSHKAQACTCFMLALLSRPLLYIPETTTGPCTFLS